MIVSWKQMSITWSVKIFRNDAVRQTISFVGFIASKAFLVVVEPYKANIIWYRIVVDALRRELVSYRVNIMIRM